MDISVKRTVFGESRHAAKHAVKPLTDTSTPEKWKAHQARIAKDREDDLPMLMWRVVRVVRQEFSVLATTRDRCLSYIGAGIDQPIKQEVEFQTMQSEAFTPKLID